LYLRDHAHRDICIKVADVAKRTEGPPSLMSKQPVAVLTEEELIHLAAFLTDRKAQEELRTQGKE
jgi:hypothetical protein